MIKRYIYILFIFLCTPFVSTAQIPFIFDTDMGNDIDDAIAMDLVYKYHLSGKINLLGVMINKEGMYPPMFIDVLNTWYGCPNIPIGVSNKTNLRTKIGDNFTNKVVDMEDGWEPLYKRTLKSYATLPYAHKLYRRLLSEAEDHSVTIVSVGFSTNLANLLSTEADDYSTLSGIELVRQKVDKLVIMGGRFDAAGAEYNIQQDVASAKAMFNKWPTAIYCSGWEIGNDICFPGSAMNSDFKWVQHHPVVDAYKAYYNGNPGNRPMWDPTAVIYAVDPQDFFTLSAPGTIVVNSWAYTIHTPNANGCHYYLITSPAQDQKVLNYMVRMVTSNVDGFRTGIESISDTDTPSDEQVYSINGCITEQDEPGLQIIRRADNTIVKRWNRK